MLLNEVMNDENRLTSFFKYAKAKIFLFCLLFIIFAPIIRACTWFSCDKNSAVSLIVFVFNPTLLPKAIANISVLNLIISAIIIYFVVNLVYYPIARKFTLKNFIYLGIVIITILLVILIYMVTLP